jgi:hypothetical protein
MVKDMRGVVDNRSEEFVFSFGLVFSKGKAGGGEGSNLVWWLWLGLPGVWFDYGH